MSIKEKEGLTLSETALRFELGVSTIQRWENCLEPKKTRNKPATKLDMKALEEDVNTYPDAYQYERAARLGVCQRAIGNALKRLGSAIKKTLAHPKADESARHTFQTRLEAEKQSHKPIVYLDESGFAQDSPRTHGYAPIGQRGMGLHNWHAKGRTNVIGALLGTTLLTATLFSCSINADVFSAWVASDLLPKLTNLLSLSWIMPLSINALTVNA